MIVRLRWVALALLAACGPPEPGMVLGDAFLVEDIGREVDLSRMSVRLIAEQEELDSALARLCPTRDREPPAPIELYRQAWSLRARLLQPLVRATTSSDPRAHFAFPDVTPGRYRLWADTVVDSVRWSWLHPITVRAGDTLRVELSNANPDENPFRCGPREHGPTPLTTKS